VARPPVLAMHFDSRDGSHIPEEPSRRA
jgi:hypothetical protein